MQDVTYIGLVSAFVFLLILLAVMRKEKLGHEWEIILSSIRMTVQLILVGFILTYIFDNPSVWFSLIALLLMLTFAVINTFQRVENVPLDMKKIVAVAMFVGTGITIFYFIFLVFRVDPWFRPQYFIPIAGMMIGNSMTGITLGIDGLINGMKDNRTVIENALMLGGKPSLIMREITGRVFYQSLLPTINSMMGMGIVFLPGMMTGQILAGAPPLEAIKYQIAIMLGIMGSVTFTVYIVIKLSSKTFFNHRGQLK